MKNFYKLAGLATVALMSFGSALTANGQASLEMVYPGPGIAFNYTTYTEIQLIFSGDPQVNGEVTVTYTSKETGQPVTDTMDGIYISYPTNNRFDININKPMDKNPGEANSGIIPPYYETYILPFADETKGMTINLYDVTVDGTPVTVNNEGNGVEIEDGNISLFYSVEQAPKLVNAVWPEKFYNYWPEGDPAGIVVLTFDQEIEKVNEANVTWGKVILGSEGGSGDDPNPFVNVTPVVKGKVVTIDFTGINFTEKTSSFVKPLSSFKDVSILVQSVVGTNGLTYMAGDFPTIVEYIEFVNEAYEGSDEPGDNPGGDEPGDNPGGDEPGDNPGGDEPGDNPGGDEPGDNPGGDEPGDNPGGDEPGDNPGGDEPGDEPGDDPDGPSSGVNSLQDENGKFTVYTLQGVKVLENANDMNSLKAGMYIVNGKKVVIRK